MNENEIEFRNVVLDEISACPLLPFFRWAPTLGNSQWALRSPHWRTVEERNYALDGVKRIIRRYFFALLRKDLYLASDHSDRFVPGLKIIVGRDRWTEHDILDTQPLRCDKPGELINPFIVGSGMAKINPQWTDAKLELEFQAPEYPFDVSLIRQSAKVEVRQGNDAVGHIFVMIRIILPTHATDGVRRMTVVR